MVRLHTYEQLQIVQSVRVVNIVNGKALALGQAIVRLVISA